MSEYVYFDGKSYEVGSSDLNNVVQTFVSDGTSAADIVRRARQNVPNRHKHDSTFGERSYRKDLHSYVENERYLVSSNASSRLNVSYTLGDVVGDIFTIVFLTCIFIIPLAVYVFRSAGGANITTEIVIAALVVASGLYFSSRKIAGTVQAKLFAAYRTGIIDEGDLHFVHNYKEALSLIDKSH